MDLKISCPSRLGQAGSAQRSGCGIKPKIKPEELREKNFKKLENSKDKPIIVVCAMGNQARGTANAMLKDGFANVSVLKGGMNAWQSASLPVSK